MPITKLINIAAIGDVVMDTIDEVLDTSDRWTNLQDLEVSESQPHFLVLQVNLARYRTRRRTVRYWLVLVPCVQECGTVLRTL